jgi:NAD(P)-dependent dehydrogenase (short-subunit alcohol dehydrogenase family)
MASSSPRVDSAPQLPDYVQVPEAAFGPALNEQGYFVRRVERNLFWVTDGTYQSAFLATPDGVVLFDAPPTIGHNLRRAVDEVAAAEGVGNTVTHLVYSYHAGAANQVHRRPGGRRRPRVHYQHDLHHPSVDPPRPRPARPGLEPTAGMATYSVSKAALVHLTRVLDLELRLLGIRVNAVAPQIIDTPKTRPYLPPDLLAHAVSPEAIADIIVYLVSDAATPVSSTVVPAYGA